MRRGFAEDHRTEITGGGGMANDDDQPARLRAFDLTNVAASRAGEDVDDDRHSDDDDGQRSDTKGGSPR
jgi:hypothetical protein